jgi:hypothetical protein
MRLASVLALALAAVAASSAATGPLQTPGFGWMVKPLPVQTIGTLFWELADRTEVWLRIAPHSPSGETIPAELIFVALFKGNVTKPDAITTVPDELNVLAEASPRVFHVSAVFTFTIADQPTIDLLAPPGTFSTGSSCDACAWTSIRATLNPGTLVAVGEAETVKATVLGMPCELDRTDTQAIAQFARRVKVLK